MLMSGNLLQHPLVCKHWAQNATILQKADSSNHPHVPPQGSSPQGSTLGASLDPIRASKVTSRNPAPWSLCSVVIMNHKTSLMSGLSSQPTWNYTAIRVWNFFNCIQKMVGMAWRIFTTFGKARRLKTLDAEHKVCVCVCVCVIYVCVYSVSGMCVSVVWGVVVCVCVVHPCTDHIWVDMESIWASQMTPVVKNASTNAGDVRDTGSIPGSGRSPGGEHGYPLQYSCLENSMDWGAGRL